MNPVKEKTCKCGKMFKPFKSTDKYCSFSCWIEGERANVIYEQKVKVKMPISRIRKVGKSREKENREYSKLRKQFLEENPWCAVYPHLRATQVHHKKGRIGRLLCDVRYFLQVSDKGHRWVELHPEEAKKLGYSLSRLEK